MLTTISGLLLACTVAALTTLGASSQVPGPTGATLLASGFEGPIGSTIGPDGALYVADGPAGRISRVDVLTGEVTTFASGLPKMIPDVGIGGVMDVAFYGQTAYALVTLVSPDVGGNDVDGIYRIDGPDSFTVIADLGQFSMDNPPVPEFFVPTGVQYAMDFYTNRFLVTDGHHNRVLEVTLEGDISDLADFDNIVPTGLEVLGSTVFMAEAGPVPHEAKDGKIVKFAPDSPGSAPEVASGANLLVDVEYGLGGFYALSQGPGMPGAPAGAPAQPNTGSLLRVNNDGTLSVLIDELDRPTSLELVGDTAYIVTLAGEVWEIDGVSELSGNAPTTVGPPSPIMPPSTGDGGLIH
jgi:sugar lactone lactonase YvrE